MSASSSRSEPGYLALHRTGELARRAERAHEMLRHCALCPRACGVDRAAGELGYCRADATVQVASHNVHMWEEPPISGTRGSGTIFFSNCTARCTFCQNYPISQLGTGERVSDERLAEMMLSLQQRGVHNINFVTPTHYAANILAAADIAAGRGLRIPLLYNTSGYDQLATLHLLDGVIDIYLPDAKYADDAVAQRISGLRGYVRADRAALQEMSRQVGTDLLLDDEGIAYRGMIVRHLVLPNSLSQTPDVLAWVAEHLPDVHVSLMSQYFPAHRAVNMAELCRRITLDEYDEALEALEAAGLERGWQQDDPEMLDR